MRLNDVVRSIKREEAGWIVALPGILSATFRFIASCQPNVAVTVALFLGSSDKIAVLSESR